MTFHSSFLPPNVTIARIPLKVRKFRQKPMQCHKCFEFGHVIGYCPNNARCYMCSGIHDLVTPCTKDRFCFLCKGPHSPNWKECPRYKLKKEVLETADNEHISLGAARRRLKPWADPGRSFASIASVSTKATPQALPVVTISKGTKPISSPNSPEATDESGVGSFIKSSTEPPLNNSEMPAQVNIDSSSNSTERCLPASQLEIHEAPITAAVPVVPAAVSSQSLNMVDTSSSLVPCQSLLDILPIDGEAEGSQVDTHSSPEPPLVTVHQSMDGTHMEADTVRHKRGLPSSPNSRTPISAINANASNRFSVLADEDEASVSFPNPSKFAKQVDGRAKDARSKAESLPTRKSKPLEKASLIAIKKPKNKSSLNKPSLSRSLHRVSGENSKTISN